MAKSLLQGLVGLERLQQRHPPLIFQVERVFESQNMPLPYGNPIIINYIENKVNGEKM